MMQPDNSEDVMLVPGDSLFWVTQKIHTLV